MDKTYKQELINYRLKKSKSTFEEVTDLIKLNYFNTAINRLYYSSFYAVLALFLKYDISTKSHAGTRQMVGKYFIQTQKIPFNVGKTYTNLFDKRLKGDYNDFFDFSEQEVIDLVEPTQIFIKTIEDLINA